MKMTEIKKVTVNNNGKVGELVNCFDGTWDIFIDGKCGGSLHYTDDQVEKIIKNKTCTIEYK